MVWSVLWFFYGSNSPAECPTISAEERDFIEKSLQQKKEDVSVGWVTFQGIILF